MQRRQFLQRGLGLTGTGLLAGAGLSVTGFEGALPSMSSLVETPVETLAEILDPYNPDWPPLFNAIYHGRVDLVKSLLRSGADVNAKVEERYSPLHAACGKADSNAAIRTEIVRTLLDHGAVVDAKDDVEETPLHLAAWRNYAEIVGVLLHAGADHDARAWGETPLHWAARYGKPEAAHVLIGRGADLEAKNRDCLDFTPLHHAARFGHPAVTAVLLDAGADLNALNRCSETPIHLAFLNDKQDVVRYLADRGACVSDVDYDADVVIVAEKCVVALEYFDSAWRIDAKGGVASKKLLLAVAERKKIPIIMGDPQIVQDIHANIDLYHEIEERHYKYIAEVYAKHTEVGAWDVADSTTT